MSETQEALEPQEPQELATPAVRRRGRPKKVREEGGVGAPNAPTSGVTFDVTPPKPLSNGFWMGLLTTQRETELEAKRDRYKRFSIA